MLSNVVLGLNIFQHIKNKKLIGASHFLMEGGLQIVTGMIHNIKLRRGRILYRLM